MNGKTLLLMIASLIAGILLADAVDLPLWAAAVPFAAASMLIGYTVMARRKNPFRRYVKTYELTAALVMTGVGMYSMSISKPEVTEYPAGKYRIEGRVEDYTMTNRGDKLLVELSRLQKKDGLTYDARNVKCLLTLKDASNVTYGSRISGEAEMQPYDQPGNALKGDYENYLKRKHIYLTGETSLGRCEVKGGPTNIFEKAKGWREKLERDIEATGLNGDTKAFLISILLGDRTYMRNEERITFSDAGVAHIFAVSGLHVSLIAGFVLGMLTLIFTGRWRRWKYLLVVPIVWGYILLVGCSPSTVRAGIMLTIGMAALFLERKNDSLKALGWAIILILAFNAEALMDIGFQLSVICVGSLLFFADKVNFINQRRHPKIYALVSIVTISMIASFSSWVVCAYYFNRFSLMFLPLNVVAVPLLPVFLITAIVYVALWHMGLDLGFVGKILDLGLEKFQESASYLTESGTAITDLHPSAIAVILWLTAILLMGLTLKNKRGGYTRRRRMTGIYVPAALLASAVINVVLFPEKGKEGFIIQKSNEPTVMSYDGGREKMAKFPENQSALMNVNGQNILALTTEEITGTIEKAMENADIIMLCAGCRNLPGKIAGRSGKRSRIVTHPSLHWRYEKRILAEALEEGLKIHSLRYDGPLHYFP